MAHRKSFRTCALLRFILVRCCVSFRCVTVYTHAFRLGSQDVKCVGWSHPVVSCRMFVLYILELYRAGDSTSLHLYWPVAKKGIQWQLSTATQFGLPYKLQTTYDILGFPKYSLSAYTSVFHLAVLKAGAVLASAAGDAAFASQCTTAFTTAQSAFVRLCACLRCRACGAWCMM